MVAFKGDPQSQNDLAVSILDQVNEPNATRQRAPLPSNSSVNNSQAVSSDADIDTSHVLLTKEGVPHLMQQVLQVLP